MRHHALGRTGTTGRDDGHLHSRPTLAPGRRCAARMSDFARPIACRSSPRPPAKVAAVYADPREKAETELKEEGWHFPGAYDMSLPQMRELGLYISDPRSPRETDRPFAEPATFAINPDGNVQVVDISNAPFSRPDLAALLSGSKFVQEKQYPVRGTKAWRHDMPGARGSKSIA